MVQPLLPLDQLWSWASTSVGRLSVAIELPVLKFKKFRSIYACLSPNFTNYKRCL